MFASNGRVDHIDHGKGIFRFQQAEGLHGIGFHGFDGGRLEISGRYGMSVEDDVDGLVRRPLYGHALGDLLDVRIRCGGRSFNRGHVTGDSETDQ